MLNATSLIATGSPPMSLDMPTLCFVSVIVVAVLGLLLVLTWLQQRNVRALAWWGAAYLIGASSMALWSAPAPLYKLPQALPAALIFVACGMMWNGVRLLDGRKLRPIAASAGALVWLVLCRFPALHEGSNGRIALGAIVVAAYTFFIAYELWRERRKRLQSRVAAIVVPGLHAAIFLIPLAMRAFLPAMFTTDGLTVFALETVIYMVGAAFIVILMVKDYDVRVYRNAANTDPLTGLLSRRAFMESARELCAMQAKRGQPVTLLMFDLDHFKAINDRFGHAMGDEALRVFARVVHMSTRGSDIFGRIGGEEFAAIVAEPMETASRIAERIRSSFESAGEIISEQRIGGTVSVGAATPFAPADQLDVLLARADAALYRAKRDGRNRMRSDEADPPNESDRLIAAVRSGQARSSVVLLQRKKTPPRVKSSVAAAAGEGATTRLLYRR
jgi:diguanylate cyclase (GGDEF)-like protein